jgi:predicted PurR-regulated permease PerM
MVVFPKDRRTEAQELIDKIDDVLGRYIRGQLAVAVIIGCTISIVLRLLGLPYAAIIGLFAGLTNLIPYVGTPIGMVAAFLVAFFMPQGGLLKGLIVLFSMYCVYITEGKVIVPTIVGKSVGLPPLVIIFSLIVGAELLAIPGMLLAVPCAAIIRVVIEHFIEKRDRNEGAAAHPFVHSRGPTSAA